MSQELPKNLFEGNQWELPTDVDIVTKTMDVFRARFVEQGWPEDDADWLAGTFEEMLVNAIVHGNLGIKEKLPEESWRDAGLKEQQKNPTNKKIHIEFSITPNDIMIRIRDEGDGFDWKKMLEQDEELLKTSGKGHAYLKLNIYDSFEYNDKGNEVTLRKKRN